MSDCEIPSPSAAASAAGPWIGPERPNNASIIRLNEGENPYSPHQNVLKAVQQTAARAIRLFPDPDSTELRNAIAAAQRLHESQVLVGPGATELLRWALLAFVDSGSKVGYLWPTWPMAERLAMLHRAECVRLNWWGATQEEAVLSAPHDLRVLYIASPNIPTGVGVDTNAIQEFAENHPQCLVLIDEAYEAFRGKNAIRLVRQGIGNVVLLRTFAKAHSLGGMRIGYALGNGKVMELVRRAMGSSPVSAASQVAALAALKATDWLDETVKKVTGTRDRVRLDIQMRGFDVPASEASFLYVRCGDAHGLYKALKARNILTGFYPQFDSVDGVRLAIGTDEQMDLFLSTLDHLGGAIAKKAPAFPAKPLFHSSPTAPPPPPASSEAIRRQTPVPVPQRVPMSDPIPMPPADLPDDLELSELDLKTEIPVGRPGRPTAPPPNRNPLGTQLTPTGVRRARASSAVVPKIDAPPPPAPPAPPAPPPQDLDDELDI
jgi:histidinol-phosphate aminotransferase